MSAFSPDVWAQIESFRPVGDELIGRQPAPDVTSRLLAAVDSRGRRHLLISLEPGDAPVRDASSRGLTVLTEDLTLGGAGSGRYINIACEDSHGHAMLDLIGAEIAERLRSMDRPPSETVSRVLAKWRRFWGQLPKQLLSQEAQIGLFAELWFLTYWLIPAAGITDAVRMWRGPFSARHDFERPGLSIEAKGTTSTRGRVYKVNGMGQLEPPEDGILLLFSLRLREEGGASNTLPLLCHACRALVSQDADAEGLLDTALITAGYLPTHEEEYSKLHLRVLEELLFDTSRAFPKLTPKSFMGGNVPPGVEDVSYTINLGSSDELIAARSTAEAAALLSGAARP